MGRYMSGSVMRVICEADTCSKLGAVAYSTNPRKYVTLEDMQNFYNDSQRFEGRVREVTGA